jgi:hypothetical protein
MDGKGGGPVAGAMREATRLALGDEWSLADAVAAVDAVGVAAALAGYEGGLVALAEAEPKLDGDGAACVRTWLKPIGMKIAPSMGADVAADWLTAVMMALSDFPARVVAQAARTAIRVPMAYLNEVDGHVRAEAERIMSRHRRAIARLKAMREEIQRAACPPVPQIAAPEDGATALSAAELRALTPELRRMGLAKGWVTQADLDAADAGVEVAA